MENKGSKHIHNYLEGKLSEQERARLETWYLLKAEQSDDSAAQTDYDQLGPKLWNQIEEALVDRSFQSSVKQHRTISLFGSTFFKIAVAATLILAATATFIMLRDNGQVDRFVIAREKDIAPGQNKAYLTLSDGRRIDLTEASAGNVASETGLEVSKSADGTLIYKASGTGTPTRGFNDISTPRGGQYTVVLPDGSKVWLNAGSSLRYPIAFGASGRSVTLMGEGYFEVAHIQTKEGRMPFTVTVRRHNGEQELVKVLGTQFNINAYDDEPTIKTTLLKGSVRIDAGGKSALLKPGQQSKVDNGRIELEPADTEMAIAWKNGDFVFREDLHSAMRKVARWYDVEVVYEASAPEKLMLGGWMSRGTNISEVLDHIQSTGKVQFRLEGRRVTVFN
ncbi:FecR family protein [Pedobacter ureilyticus]|uniref:FecR family protein n=1 Tax=Pedobacter ureilyticus TaxID=1393051 RepID=A0ABW9J9S7_9SPHI|nr:FecR family protein [Pedobacter helvus]